LEVTGNDLVNFPVEQSLMPNVRSRVNLAQKLYKLTAKLEHVCVCVFGLCLLAYVCDGRRLQRTSGSRRKPLRWTPVTTSTSFTFSLTLDSTSWDSAARDAANSDTEMLAKRDRRQRDATVSDLRAQLSSLLANPLIRRGACQS
jgi:hypothetical protein